MKYNDNTIFASVINISAILHHSPVSSIYKKILKKLKIH